MVDIPAIYGNAPYDWKTAFQPISHIQSVPAVIVVTPSSPIKTFAEFIKVGIDKPGSLTIADSGVGTTNHLVIELMSDASGAKYTLVHYKGSGPGLDRRHRGPGAGTGRPAQQRDRPHQGRQAATRSP